MYSYHGYRCSHVTRFVEKVVQLYTESFFLSLSLSLSHTHTHTQFTSLLWSNQLSLTCYIPIHSTYTGLPFYKHLHDFVDPPILFLSNGLLIYSSTSNIFAKTCVYRLTCFDTNHTFLHRVITEMTHGHCASIFFVQRSPPLAFWGRGAFEDWKLNSHHHERNLFPQRRPNKAETHLWKVHLNYGLRSFLLHFSLWLFSASLEHCKG